MYNTEQKEIYIKEKIASESYAKFVRSIFEACSKFEYACSKDLCVMNEEELRETLNSVLGIRGNSQCGRIIILRDYVRWCIVSGVGGACDTIFNIRISGVNRIKQTMVATPLHLQICLDKIFGKESSGTIECTYRCYYWLAYAGVDEADILGIKASDINFKKQSIRVRDKEFILYREAIQAFQEAVNSYEFVYEHPRYKSSIVRARCDGDEIMRGFSVTPSTMAMRVELSRRNKKCIDAGLTDVTLSYSRVRLSGLFYRTYYNEMSGIPVSFESFVSDLIDGKDYKLPSKYSTMETKQKQIENGYRQDYERWKSAFFI